jgi:hypothetical protein
MSSPNWHPVAGGRFADPAAPRNPGRSWRGIEFWNPAETPAFAARFHNDMQQLTNEFPEDFWYVHPIKLSQWR